MKLIFPHLLAMYSDQLFYVNIFLDLPHGFSTLIGCLTGGKGLGCSLLLVFEMNRKIDFTLGHLRVA